MSTHTIMSRLKWPLGFVLGLLAALLVMPLLGSDERAKAETTIGPVLSDCDGTIRELVIQYNPGSAPVVAAPYKEFLSQLPSAVTVHVVCRDRAAFDDLLTHVGKTACKLSPVFADHEMTSWSRDRWICLAPDGDSSTYTLVSPAGELGAEAWAARKGDEEIGNDLAEALGVTVASVRSELFFDGGDFVCDDKTAFVTPALLRRNLQVTLKSEAELRERLAHLLGRDVVLLKDAPDHHAGMYMMAVGDRTVLVGDPRLARDILTDAERDALPLPAGVDFGDETIAKLDSVAAQCEAAGYTVKRIPLVPGADGRVFLTYLNSILDERDGARTVYMPVFDGAEKMNEAGAKVWRELGYEVKPVNCTTCYKFFGSLRCLVNVLKRD